VRFFEIFLRRFDRQNMAWLSRGDVCDVFQGHSLPLSPLPLFPFPFSFFLFSLSNKKEKREKCHGGLTKPFGSLQNISKTSPKYLMPPACVWRCL